MSVLRRRVVVFAKEPWPGRVKTRLARRIGTIAAARWYRQTALALVRRLGVDPRWEVVIATAPDSAGARSRVWPHDVPRWPQGVGSLGDRMGRVLRTAPPGPVIIVGADIPDIQTAHIARAFEALGRADAVFGPATDGGYWLIGLKRTPRRAPADLFNGVRWSTEHALADTKSSLSGCRILEIDRLGDVDEFEDLPRSAQARWAQAR